MSFNSNSLEYLRKLRRTLPKPLPSSKPASESNKNIDSTLHPIETEENPQKLFKELIKASPDGNIPSHLIERLKKMESLNIEQKDHLTENTNAKYSTARISNQYNNTNQKSSEQLNDLYISFKRLLLEEED